MPLLYRCFLASDRCGQNIEVMRICICFLFVFTRWWLLVILSVLWLVFFIFVVALAVVNEYQNAKNKFDKFLYWITTRQKTYAWRSKWALSLFFIERSIMSRCTASFLFLGGRVFCLVDEVRGIKFVIKLTQGLWHYIVIDILFKTYFWYE